jgi:hypothetical protein
LIQTTSTSIASSPVSASLRRTPAVVDAVQSAISTQRPAASNPPAAAAETVSSGESSGTTPEASAMRRAACLPMIRSFS